MSTFSFVEQLLARDPRKLVRFPDFPVDAAMAELRELQEQLAQAEKQANAPAPGAPASGSAAPIPSTGNEGMGPSIATLATQIWRTKAKLVDTATGEPREEARKVYRHVEGALEALGQMGITLNDWLNQPYDPGLPVKVITFQPTTGIVRDTVVETVRPTIIWKDQLLQLGEVVVGIPPNTEKPQ